MSRSFARVCCVEFDKAIKSISINEWLRLPTAEDLKAILKLQKTFHDVEVIHQISQDTADILIPFGKEEWFVPREDKVEAKGKGALSTYFLKLEGSSEGGNDASSVGASSSAKSSLIGSQHSRKPVGASVCSEERRNSSIDWTVDVLANALKAIVARRNARGLKPSSEKMLVQLEQASIAHDGTKIVIDEVSSYVALPGFDDADFGVDVTHVVLSDGVVEELKDYVQSVAELYNSNNPFHNFDHANHVVLSVNKLLSRIKSPDFEGGEEELFNHTFGIATAPLTWFAVVLSALIHDVDHSGVSNVQLLKEKSPLSFLYQNKSVAEQNSFDIGWDLLMEVTYRNLRRTIYTTTDHLFSWHISGGYTGNLNDRTILSVPTHG
ncbi:3'5'-cyclic nucleotide phosphodiesterase [Nitzschia inconspicua]|uniref:3'5'-cyclic nucleotide phosphodiesterase n=1 Tax=Nitzschia inconspicua TaxID=303405 RepID=A0A9K3KJE9_9STRA|nr:3'5'-cyclic nucleotide phosphodiesterase [Nitzschia inconspicua]